MSLINELIDEMKTTWGAPNIALHRGREIPFKLQCFFNQGVSKNKFNNVEFDLPSDIKEFFRNTDGATLFKDEEFGQWGLDILNLNESFRKTEVYLSERNRDSLNGDFIIGEFIGDSDLLLLRCDPSNDDFGMVVVVSAIEPRVEWDIVAKTFENFLSEYYKYQGDKYWEN